jgi:hypothetical protein
VVGGSIGEIDGPGALSDSPAERRDTGQIDDGEGEATKPRRRRRGSRGSGRSTAAEQTGPDATA